MGRRLPGDRDPLDPLDPLGAAPGPGPIGPRPPRPPIPPIPWTPFGPGDNATPDVASIEARAAGIRAELEKVQLELTGMRYGPGPDGTPPVVREVTRADGLWPFLVIRTYPGDVGVRPVLPSHTVTPYNSLVDSPDVVVTPAGPPGEPSVVGRSGIAAIKAREINHLTFGQSRDLWAHVWNLGHFQATGVRVRAWLSVAPDTPHLTVPPPRFLGGAAIDLGDRTSDTAHRMVKVATFAAEDFGIGYYWTVITVTAECLTDPAEEQLVWAVFAADRHSAHCALSVHA